MPAYRFPSDTNAQLLGHALKDMGLPHRVEDDTVSVDADNDDVFAYVAQFGGWDVPDPRSSIGVNPFLDIGAQAVRSNPPMAARGGEPLEPRKRPPFSEEPTFTPTQPDRLLGMRPAKVPRRSTRGQPL